MHRRPSLFTVSHRLARGPARDHKSLIRLNLVNYLAPRSPRFSISPSSCFATLSSKPQLSFSPIVYFPLSSRVAVPTHTQARNMSSRTKDPREDMSEEQLLDLLRLCSFGKNLSLRADEKDTSPTWGKSIYADLKAVRASLTPNASATFNFFIKDEYTNRSGNLHGGCTASIFDVATSMILVLVQKEGFWMRWGVSRTLNVSYLRPVPAGITVQVHCEVVSLGKRLVQMRALMTDEAGNILATCEHGKVNIDSKI
ncbi:hypothetical protein TWF718_003979 [Orbilia javanica]|uniref:Thioesterase domain-containing protein n=1 Tax=Orbilia javanica TaxID=47235 RepID=A0AAN8MRN7_9PEZI